MREWRRSFQTTYLTVDPRSLGVFRVVFGLVLFIDLGRRFAELGHWYVNSGLLPNHTMLWRPPAGRMFSLFFTASTTGEARFGFVLCALAYASFLLGYRTRWAQVLTLLARVSLNSRLLMLENGGDMVINLLCLLTLPLPLGNRFSIDAVAASLRAERRAGANPHPPRGVVAWAREPVVSVAVLGLLLQFGTIYFMNAAAKSGQAWRDGSAVHYALHQDKLVTWAGVWMREHLSPSMFHALTWSVLTTEWLGVILILTPIYVRELRWMAVIIMPALHTGFALGLNLGGFSLAMLAFYPLLLGHEHWDVLERRFGARLGPLCQKLEDAVRRLPAYALPRVTKAPSFALRTLGESATLLLLIAITTEVLNDNTPVPPALRVPQPAWAKAIIEYPRILQGWRMFANEPPRGDSMIYVDATTSTGAHVDPYNEVASDQPFPAGETVPRHMGQSQFFVMYSERISAENYSAYRSAFSEWLQAYPERTHHPEDCLLSYEVYLVTDTSPVFASASKEPTKHDRQRFMSYSAPSDSPCRTRPHKSSSSTRTSQL
jgi:hypothetical protein